MAEKVHCDQCGAQALMDTPGSGWLIVQPYDRRFITMDTEPKHQFCSPQCTAVFFTHKFGHVRPS